MQIDTSTFTAIAECFTEAIVLLDSQGAIVAANRSAQNLLGSAATLNELLDDAPDKLEDYLHTCLESTDVQSVVLNLRHQTMLCMGWGAGSAADKTSRIVLKCVVPTESEFDTTAVKSTLLQLTTEIERRRLAEQRLRKRELEARQHRERLVHVARLSTMGEMAAGIAHEINQPLTAIATYASACHRMLASDLGDTEEVLDTLDKIGLQARRAGEVIQRLRSFVKRQESQRETCDLNELVADTMVLAETDARLHAYTIETDYYPQPLFVEVDLIQIQQVLLNLIRNGMDAMLEAETEAGCLRVTTAMTDDDFAVVAVRDQGIGIAPEQDDKLFSPFFTTKSNGIGLGLSISRSIINAHGGRLKFERNSDQGVTQGVTMYFTLPIDLLNEAHRNP